MNLVQQQNMLKELSDGQLSQVMQSGTVPQFMVVAEAKRREEARKRYTNMKQKYDSTVADQVMQGLQPSALSALGMQPQQPPASGGLDAAMAGGAPDMGGMPMPPPDQGGGLDAAMPQDPQMMDPSMGQPPAFARGGAVHRYATPGVVSPDINPDDMMIQYRLQQAGMAGLPAAVPASSPFAAEATAASQAMDPITFNYPEFKDPYAGIRDLYAKQLGEIDKEKEKAGALALISAGLGIAGGKSQNFARNLAGAQDAIKGYGETLGSLNDRQQALTQGQAQTDVLSAQARSASRKDFPETSEGRRQLLDQMSVDTSTPAAKAFIATGANPELVFGVTRIKDLGDLVQGEDTTAGDGKAVWARLNNVTKEWEDPNGNVIPGFRQFGLDELAARKTELNELAKDKLVPSEYSAAAMSVADTQANTERLNKKILNAVDLVRSGKVTGVFQMAEAVPGPQRELANIVSTLKSNAAISALQQLRASSSNGASGFGQLTQREFAALEDTIGKLDRFNGPEEFLGVLQDYQSNFNQIYRKAVIWLNKKLRDNPGVSDEKFETELGLVRDLGAIDQQISQYTSAFGGSGAGVGTGAEGAGVSMKPNPPNGNAVDDLMTIVKGQ